MNLEKIFGCCDVDKVNMAKLTTFASGGKTTLVTVKCTEQLKYALEQCVKCDLPYLVLGNGSNCIAHDDGFDGIVIKLASQLATIDRCGNDLIVGGGAQGGAIASFCVDAQLAGAEFLGCIPTTAGGAVACNSGCYGASVSEILHSVQLFDGKKEHTLTPKELQMSYRHCVLPKGFVITCARFRLTQSEGGKIQANLSAMRERKRKEQPLDKPSAGSVFICEDTPPALLIDRAGLKGFCIGGAQVSKKHAGFIINKGGATAKDLQAVIDFIRKKIYDTYALNLRTEIRFLPSR